MRRALNWIIGLPLAVIVVVFAVANRQWTVVSLDPISRDQPLASISMPLWALLFLGAFVGLLAGWIACWLQQGRWRRAARETRHELQRARAETAALERETQGNLPMTQSGPV